MRQFEIMTTSGCHLCEIAEQLLHQAAFEIEFQLYEVDISQDDSLVEQYGVRIPVIVDSLKKKELNWPFDSATLKQFLLAED